MIKCRNLLCTKQKSKLDLGTLLLYEPYKNILQRFVELATKREAKDFDPVAKVYHGLLSAPPQIRNYYEALLGVTSYYQASKGGRGRYIEKKLASSFEFCSLDIKLSELPLWLTYPALHKKKGLFTQQGLSTDEKRLILRFPWDWLGDVDEETDVGSIIKNEKTMVLMETKNRVDSGGTAARREVWTSQKFGIILDYLIKDKKIYRKHQEEGVEDFTLAEMLLYFKIQSLQMYIGILFDVSDSPANIEADKRRGFYSSSREGFSYLLGKIKDSQKFEIIEMDEDKLEVELKHKPSNLTIKCGALYGDKVTETLFREKVPVSDLLLLKYDDIWLSQLVAIEERSFLLKNNKNYSTIFKDLLKRDQELRLKYEELINSECKEEELKGIITYLFQKYSDFFSTDLVPQGRNREEYLADVIQVLCASDS